MSYAPITGTGTGLWTTSHYWIVPRRIVPAWLLECWVIVSTTPQKQYTVYWSKESFRAGVDGWKNAPDYWGRRGFKMLYAIHVKRGAKN